MKNCAEYIAISKLALGDARMSDRALGEHLGYAQQTIAKAKSGQMSDAVALAVGELLKKHQVIDHAGEVLLVAHAERDADPRVRKTLMDFAKNVLASVPVKAASAFAALAVALGLMFSPAHDAQAFGGAGR